MTDLQALRGRIPGYPGYAGTDERHQTDKLVRALLGEALAAARERLKPGGAVGEQLEGLLLRCEFSDQRFIRAADHARFDDALSARVQTLDGELAGCAERIREAADEGSLAVAMDAAARALDERSGAVAEAPTA